MTRQRVYQRRHRAQGLCANCARPALSVVHCARHLLAERRRRRTEMGYGAWLPGGRGAMPTRTDAELEAVVAREDEADYQQDRRDWETIQLAGLLRRVTGEDTPIFSEAPMPLTPGSDR